MTEASGQNLIDSVKGIDELLAVAETPALRAGAFDSGSRYGLWATVESKDRIVATKQLTTLLQEVGSKTAAIQAVVACEATVRAGWARVVAARLRELGDRRDMLGLCEAVSVLGLAAKTVLEKLPEASLAETGLAALERKTIGAVAHEATATPRLLRALGATGQLVEGGWGAFDTGLDDVDSQDPNSAWVDGRVLCIPEVVASGSPYSTPTAVLHGEIGRVPTVRPKNSVDLSVMEWVLDHPWAFLLAQIVFTQEAWAAERVSGHLALELEEGHLSVFSNPPQVCCVVTTADGNEIACGTLGGLVLRVLAELGVVLLTADASVEKMDDALRPVIGVLLERNVWRFDHGLAGGRPGYEIHSRFSDECYRALGSRSFYRRGASVTLAIRQVCEAWAQERLGGSDGKVKQ